MTTSIARSLALVACLSAALAVGIGAIGTHALPGWLEAKGFDAEKVAKRMDQCEKAVRYQLVHTMAILVVAIVPGLPASSRRAAWLMVVGMALFSGGLYGLVFAELPTVAIIPFGGVAFIVAWLWLGWSLVQAGRA